MRERAVPVPDAGLQTTPELPWGSGCSEDGSLLSLASWHWLWAWAPLHWLLAYPRSVVAGCQEQKPQEAKPARPFYDLALEASVTSAMVLVQ